MPNRSERAIAFAKIFATRVVPPVLVAFAVGSEVQNIVKDSPELVLAWTIVTTACYIFSRVADKATTIRAASLVREADKLGMNIVM